MYIEITKLKSQNVFSEFDIMRLDKDAMIEKMQEIINKVPPKYYADILYDKISSINIQQSISGENLSVIPRIDGFVFRIFDGSIFHEISDSNLFNLEERVLKLQSNIEYNPIIEFISYPKHSIDKEFSMKNDFTLISLEEKHKKIMDLHLSIRKIDQHVINPVITYKDSMLERIFINNEGSLLRQKIPRTYLEIKPIVSIDNKTDYDTCSVGSEGGFEIFEQINNELLEKLVKSSIELTTAPHPPSGKIPVILDPTIAGNIAHAVFGHSLQGDQILRGRSIWEKFYLKQVASEIVNISDSPIEEGAYGSYLFDDEGVMCKKTPLIEKGVITNYLHSRVTASILKMENNLFGNGRRQDYLHPVYPRNSNTFVEPGDYSKEEMIHEMEYGVLVSQSDFGMEDPIGGGIQTNSRSGFLIENGEISTRVKSIALSGNALDLLMSIDAVSKGPISRVSFNSRKGREDIVPVSFGGVFVRAQNIFISPG
nr:protease TldD [Candidatus Prometheoarchaeum syntrophicum]